MMGIHDFRYALRSLLKRPGFTAVAATVLFFTIATGVQAGENAVSGADAPIRQMAITVDDLPAARSHALPLARQEYITLRVVASLLRHGVPAVGFVNESKLEVDGRVDPRGVALLERWLESGMELGNHGYAHLDLHRVGAERWMEDVLLGERVIRPLVEARGEKLRWFRHPFLHAGLSADVQQQVAASLADQGYRIAPVTIDNGEWIYAREYAEALDRGDALAARRLGDDYVRYMLDVVAFYELQAREILGRPLPHVLLIHANLLNADRLGALLERPGSDWLCMGASRSGFGRSGIRTADQRLYRCRRHLLAPPVGADRGRGYGRVPRRAPCAFLGGRGSGFARRTTLNRGMIWTI